MGDTPTTLPQGEGGDLYQITAPFRYRHAGFCAGFVVIDGKVRRWAPILGWAKYKSIGEIREICQNNGWHLDGPIKRAPNDDRDLLP